jgi:hypothetical protein
MRRRSLLPVLAVLPFAAGPSPSGARAQFTPAGGWRLDRAVRCFVGCKPVGSTPEEFASFQAAELPGVAGSVRLSGAAVE